MRKLITKTLYLTALGLVGTVLGWFVPVLLGSLVP